MSSDIKPKIDVDGYYQDQFDKMMNNPKHKEIRPLFIALYEKLVSCEKRKKNNFISKSANSLIEILIGVNFGIFIYSDKPFESIESKALALITSLLIIFLILFNFMGDSD